MNNAGFHLGVAKPVYATDDWQARALAAEAKLSRLEGLERAATMALQQLYHANAGAFENGVTNSTGSIDEGNVRAGEIIHDLELALGVSRHAYASENGE